MKWESEKHIENNKYDIPGNWLHIEYFEALNLLFRIENSLRVFVYIILKNEFKEKWTNLSITSDDEEKSTIGAIAKRRLSQDNNYAYLGYSINSPLLHLTSGELIRIITSDSYWKYFKKYFLGTKEIIKNKLDEIGNIRNSLAHFRPIKKGDVDLIKQNANHTLGQVEKTLADYILCPDTVPTNTNEDWYKELKPLSNNECSINFKQSKNENWIKMHIEFQCPIIERKKLLESFVYIKTFNIKTANLLSNYQNLTTNTISITENASNIFTQNVDNLKITKSLKFTFSKKTIETNFQDIKNDIESIFLKITEELDLISQDNLARGTILEVIALSFRKKENSKYFGTDNKNFITETENTPPEFWGKLDHTDVNFVSNSEFYPWIPVSISDDKDSLF